MGTVKADDFQNSAGTGAPKFSKGIDLSQAAGFTKRKISSITSNTTLTSTDGLEIILADATSGAITVTLPAAASSSGRTLTIKKTDSSVNLVTVDGNASETIDGDLTKKLGFQYDFMEISCDGSNWHIATQNRKVMCIAIGVGGPDTTPSKNTFNTITTFSATSDPFGMFTSGGIVVIKEAGWYNLLYNNRMYLRVNGSAPTYVSTFSYIYINGSSTVYSGNNYVYGSVTNSSGVVVQTELTKYLNANDTIYLVGFMDHTGGSISYAGYTSDATANYFSVVKI